MDNNKKLDKRKQKKKCKYCNKLYSYYYLKVHIEKVHSKDLKSKNINLNKIKMPDEKDLDLELEVLFDQISLSDTDPDELKCKKAKQRNNIPEKSIQKKLEKKLKAGHKMTPAGEIDILTDNELIEIKNWKDWIKAVGQVIVYGHYYPKHMKRIHFFGTPPSQEKQIIIREICASLAIKITHEK